MSRTDNTMPWLIQREDRPAWTHWMAFGGSYARIRRWCRPRHKGARRRANVALAAGNEPVPSRQRSARRDYY